jgi:hypothetical protein
MNKKIIAVIIAVIVIVSTSGVIAYQAMGNNKTVNPTPQPTVTPTINPSIEPALEPILTPTATPTPTPTVTYKVVKADQYFEYHPQVNASETDVVITVQYNSPIVLRNTATCDMTPTVPSADQCDFSLISPDGTPYKVSKLNSEFAPNSSQSYIEFRVLGNYTISDFKLSYHGDQNFNLVQSP